MTKPVRPNASRRRRDSPGLNLARALGAAGLGLAQKVKDLEDPSLAASRWQSVAQIVGERNDGHAVQIGKTDVR